MIEVFTQCLETLGRFFSGRSSMGQHSQLILAVTLERLDSLSSFLQPLLKSRLHIGSLSKDDRLQVLNRFMPAGDHKKKEIQKYLQGKPLKEIKSIINRIFRKNAKADFITELVKLEKDRKMFGENAVKIPEVKWDDVGGLAGAKEEIIQTIMLPIEQPHLFVNGVT